MKHINNTIFIFSHYDDEFGLFNAIENSVNNINNVYVFYLTNGLQKENLNNIKKLHQREKESLNILLKLGVKKKNIILLGKKFNIPVYHLYKNLDIIYRYLNKFLKKLRGKHLIYTHAWEGGNEDHDACFVITKKILFKYDYCKKGLQFSQYHRSNSNFYPFKIQTLIRSRSKIYRTKLNLTSKIRYILYLFNYVSQFYLWIPIYPFIIYKILINDYGNVKIISKNLNLSKPHSGDLLYERMRKNRYNNLKKFFLKFLKTK